MTMPLDEADYKGSLYAYNFYKQTLEMNEIKPKCVIQVLSAIHKSKFKTLSDRIIKKQTSKMSPVDSLPTGERNCTELFSMDIISKLNMSVQQVWWREMREKWTFLI